VRSSVSTSSVVVRKFGDAGIGAVTAVWALLLDFVGVAAGESRHASRVVCFAVLGLAATDPPREVGATLVIWAFAFLAEDCEGEGNGGRSTRSNVSIVSNDEVSVYPGVLAE